MSATPHANGGLLTRDLDLPDFRDVRRRRAAAGAACVRRAPAGSASCCATSTPPTRTRFRLFCPDETNSNRLGAVFEVSDRAFMEATTADDVALSPPAG